MTFAASWIEAKRLQSLEISLIRKVMESAPPDAINLALGELGFPMPVSLKEQAVEILSEGSPAYTPNAGLPELRAKIGSLHNASAEQVVVCNGAEEAIFIALMSMLNPGDLVAIPDPDYPAYPAVSSILEASVIRLPFEPDFQTINWEMWDSLLTGVKVLIFSAPSNPSGFFFDSETATRLADLCNRHKVTVIVDEIYSRLWFYKMPVDLTQYLNRLIRIGGLSKSHLMSGWRMGWIIAPAEMARTMTKAKQYISTCSHWLSQKLALYALSDEGMEIAEQTRQQLKANREWVKERFEHEMPISISHIHYPDASPYILLQTQEPYTYCQLAAEKGVILVPGVAFGKISAGYVRLNFGVPIELLEQAVQRIS